MISMPRFEVVLLMRRRSIPFCCAVLKGARGGRGVDALLPYTHTSIRPNPVSLPTRFLSNDSYCFPVRVLRLLEVEKRNHFGWSLYPISAIALSLHLSSYTCFLCIVFHRVNAKQANTRGIVVGTRSGDLYECSLESNGKERAFSLVYSLGSRQQGSGGAGGSGGGVLGGAGGIGMGRDVGDGGLGAAGGGRDGSGIGGSSGGVVAALHLESMSAAVHGETHVFVMAVTANPLRLHIFMGGPTLEVRGAAAVCRLPPLCSLRIFECI